MGIHDHVRTNSFFIKGHIFLRNNDTADPFLACNTIRKSQSQALLLLCSLCQLEKLHDHTKLDFDVFGSTVQYFNFHTWRELVELPKQHIFLWRSPRKQRNKLETGRSIEREKQRERGGVAYERKRGRAWRKESYCERRLTMTTTEFVAQLWTASRTHKSLNDHVIIFIQRKQHLQHLLGYITTHTSTSPPQTPIHAILQ